jgi:predicted component of type VI protein secretion system
MVAVADLERLLERLFEQTAARLFRSRLQAVHVERRVERAMEGGRAGRGSSTLVPNRFRVRLNPADLGDLVARSGGDGALAADLAERALAFARRHGYHLAARPFVILAADPAVEVRAIEVDASVWRPERPAAPSVGRGTVPVSGQADAGDADEVSRLVRPPAVSGQQPAAASPAASADAPAPGGIRSPGDRPLRIRPAVPPVARALLRVIEAGGREREVRVGEEPLTLGRAPDNGLVIADTRVSRHHGRFTSRHGTLVYTDLASTNGTRVNGIRVDEVVLGPGDRLQVGDALVVVEQLPR